jgi:hypothetical protein
MIRRISAQNIPAITIQNNNTIPAMNDMLLDSAIKLFLF